MHRASKRARYDAPTSSTGPASSTGKNAIPPEAPRVVTLHPHRVCTMLASNGFGLVNP
eukprot:m.475296 g.475296  ORF g.475296 m.475296 type:complete len:58 (+) comp38070_c0_seq1:81-254(+)